VFEIIEKEKAMEPIITLNHVCKTFTTADGEVTAVNDLNLAINRGDIFGIIGLSGAGKSTLVRCLNLLGLHVLFLAIP
jgi:D-methionine transport system ATP-binding protein